MREIAYAKINLALHLRARREDGYHELETLFAFLDAGDVLTAVGADADRLETVGEFAGVLDNPFDNIVARAMNVLPRERGLSVTLEKNLPVAAGLGGGSADAGALFRIVRALHGLPEGWQERAARLGADVPACVESGTAIGRGTGTDLRPLADNSLDGLHVLLVNPRVPLSTGPVFAAWDGRDRGEMPGGTAREITLAGRNDLEKPAISLCPAISDVLQALRDTDPLIARMSGSGATCFALYESAHSRNVAAKRISRREPGWWQMKGNLRC